MLNTIELKRAKERRDSILSARRFMKVNPGWIKYTRLVLGMTLKELAKRAGLSIPTVAQTEKREAEGKITLENLAKFADAMECELVYAFVPKDEVKNIIKKQAYSKALKSLSKTSVHMELEDQAVRGELQERAERIAEKLISKGKVW